MKVKTRIWLKSNHTKVAKDRCKLLKGGGEAGSSFGDLVLAPCLLLLAPNGKGERAPPPSNLTSCGACLLDDLHLHPSSSKLQSPSPFSSFPSSSPCLSMGRVDRESDELETEGV